MRKDAIRGSKPVGADVYSRREIILRDRFRLSAEAMLASVRNMPNDPGMSDEHDFFRLRRAAKTYISKVFTYGVHTTERLRMVRMVMDGSDVLHLGEVEGALCLRLSGEKRRTQVTAVVSYRFKARSETAKQKRKETAALTPS